MSSIIFRAETIAMTDETRAQRIQSSEIRYQNSEFGTGHSEVGHDRAGCEKVESEIAARVKALYGL